MKQIIVGLLIGTIGFACCTVKNTSESDKELSLIPRPSSIEFLEGSFEIDNDTEIVLANNDEELKLIVPTITSLIGLQDFSDKDSNVVGTNNKIIIELSEDILVDEGYSLSVRENQIHIKSKTPSGAFYAIQTLSQLTKFDKPNSSVIPAVKILDEPRFPYRGMHLDVSRHFYGVEHIKSIIDQLAKLKINYFHWHLTDDQGWRIEIKKYPKLTEIGAYRNETLVGHYNDQPHQFDGQRYGGFYSQDEIREVVEYARERFITIIPEIELPGHAQAAIAAYPYLACKNEKLDVWTLWGVSDNVFCPTEKTFGFLEDVLDEVISLFPGKYIHIGGDECPKTQWKESTFCQRLMKKEGLKDEHELQSYFIQRIEKYINSKGKQIIGWDEILEGGLAPNATVMSWRGIKGGIEAAKMGHDVIMTPTSHCYFDYYQSDHPDEPLAIGGLIPLEKIYSYEPIPDALEADQKKYILGAQANIWTEYIQTRDHLEYMIFPRICALAEVVWTGKENRDFDDFVERLIPYMEDLKADGINVANHLYDLRSVIQPKEGIVSVSLESIAKDAEVYYTTSGVQPSLNSNYYDGLIAVDSSLTFKAQAFKDSKAIGRPFEKSISFHKAAGKKIQFKTAAHQKYSGDGQGSVINGVLGSNERYGDTEWLGFEGNDAEAIIDFGKSMEFNKVNLRFFKGEGQWIYLPRKIELFVSEDGENYQLIAEAENVDGDTKVVEKKLDFTSTNSQFLKIKIENYGLIPEGAQGAGNRSWLFIDEIRVY